MIFCAYPVKQGFEHAIITNSTVAVAQLVESRIVIPVVVGSSPISHPKSFNKKASFLAGFFVS